MTPPVTGPIPLCLRLSEAAETLDTVALTLEDATEVEQPAEHCREVAAELAEIVPLIARTLAVLDALAAGRLSPEEVSRLE